MTRAARIAVLAGVAVCAVASVAAAQTVAPAGAPAAPAAGAPAVGSGGPVSGAQMVVILTLVSLAPAIVLTCTTFARFVIVLGFLRTGLGTQGAPPNQVLVGTALFMTLFVMAPTMNRVADDAVTPYLDGQLGERAAFDRAVPPIREFLLAHTRDEDLGVFYAMTDEPRPATGADVPLRIAIPAFVLSELRTAFEMGLTILLPFLVIDLLVALVLTSMGMMMMPPVVVAMPVKLLVFVAVDGWRLVVESLMRGAL